MNGSKDNLIGLVRQVLASKGLEVKGTLKISLRYPGEGFGAMRLESLDKFVRLFGDGKYYIEGDNIIVQGIEEHPFSIAYFFVDSEYKEGKWTVKIYTDPEDIYTDDVEYLERRREKITASIKSSLELLAFFIQLYSRR